MERDEVRKVVGAFVGALLEGGTDVDALPDGDPMKVAGRKVGNAVTATVGYLATAFPHPTVNRLMVDVWHLVGSRTVPAAIGPVSTPSVAAVKRDGEVRMVILFPVDWVERAARDPSMAMGAMVCCGSQARDFYNGRIVGEQDAVGRRAGAHEADLLHVLAADPTWRPNEYQRGVMTTFPQGTETPSVAGLLYEPKETPASTSLRA